MKTPLLILKNLFIVYTTIWAIFSALNFYGLSSPKDYGWVGLLIHFGISLVFAFIISMDDLLLAVKSEQKNKITDPLKGEWTAEYCDENGSPMIRKDIWDLTGIIDNKVLGTIKREEPESENGKKWLFSGYLMPDQLHIAFTHTDENNYSRGCALLKRVSSKEATPVFEGYYYKWAEGDKPRQRVLKLTKMKNKQKIVN